MGFIPCGKENTEGDFLSRSIREIVSRKERKGLAKDANLLCGLGVSFAPFAGNFRRNSFSARNQRGDRVRCAREYWHAKMIIISVRYTLHYNTEAPSKRSLAELGSVRLPLLRETP